MSLAAYRFIDQCVRCMMCLSGTSSPLIRTPARAEALPFLSLFFSLVRKVFATLSRNPRVTLVTFEVSAPVHSFLRSFSFRDVSYDLLFNHATGSKYSFATNFHLHVSSPWVYLVPQTCVLFPSYTISSTPFYFFRLWYWAKGDCKRIKRISGFRTEF